MKRKSKTKKSKQTKKQTNKTITSPLPCCSTYAGHSQNESCWAFLSLATTVPLILSLNGENGLCQISDSVKQGCPARFVQNGV